MVMYFVTSSLKKGSLLQRFFDGDDDFRNSRLKLIPSVPKVFLHPISMYGVTTVLCPSLHFDLKKEKNKTAGLLDSAAECWQLPLFVGKGIGL
jgi:hypothetical protein